ncbi:MAG: Na+/H+ antiporter subunit E [Sedimentisphaerales bacterium]|nr:Na+/H+ antiporter subunit E [Sedimentisphaerales bacterium]
MLKHLGSFLVLMIIWILLSWSADPQQIITGVLLAALLTLFLAPLRNNIPVKILNPIRWFWFIVYTVYFIYYCLRANLDVAYRALHPDTPITPGIVKVHTDLKTDIAKTFLANSITLTPGTLTIDLLDDTLFIHWINIVTTDPDQQNEIIVKRFERILKRIFE